MHTPEAKPLKPWQAAVMIASATVYVGLLALAGEPMLRHLVIAVGDVFR